MLRRTAIAILAATTCLAVASCGQEEPPKSEPATTISFEFRGGKVTPEPDKVSVKAGAKVTVMATSDVPEEVHVHSYNQVIVVEPGITAEKTFTADVPGLFEVEMEKSGVLAFELEVNP